MDLKKDCNHIDKCDQQVKNYLEKFPVGPTFYQKKKFYYGQDPTVKYRCIQKDSNMVARSLQ